MTQEEVIQVGTRVKKRLPEIIRARGRLWKTGGVMVRGGRIGSNAEHEGQ